MEEILQNNDPVEITKAESNPTASSSRIRLGEVGTPYVRAVGGFIQDEKRKDLKWPNALVTYDKMAEDATISSVLNLNYTFLLQSLMNSKFIPGVAKTQASKDFANFLNWNFNNLADQTKYEVYDHLVKFNKEGTSWFEKVFELNKSRQWGGQYQYKLKKLAPRRLASIARPRWSDDGRTLLGVYQYASTKLSTPEGMFNLVDLARVNGSNTYIPANKCLFFAWDKSPGNFLGTSPLNGAYVAWKEKTMIASYEVVGVAKDMGGMLVLRVPNEVINRAAENPNSDEAAALKELQKNAALAHAGDQNYILLGSDTQGQNGNGNFEYDVQLIGVDGGGKQYSTKDLINERKKAILDIFGAGFLNLGNESHGSYALADTKQSLHAFYMERQLLFIANVFVNDLVKQLAELNGVYLSEDEMPRMQFGTLDQQDPEVLSKVGNRLGAQQLFPRDKEFLLSYYEDLGLDIEPLQKYSQEELSDLLIAPQGGSGNTAGGDGSSGTGQTQAGGLGSDLNSENSA